MGCRVESLAGGSAPAGMRPCPRCSEAAGDTGRERLALYMGSRLGTQGLFGMAGAADHDAAVRCMGLHTGICVCQCLFFSSWIFITKNT